MENIQKNPWEDFNGSENKGNINQEGYKQALHIECRKGSGTLIKDQLRQWASSGKEARSFGDYINDNPTINYSLVRYDSYCSHKPHGTSKPNFYSTKVYLPSIRSISKIQYIQQ